MNYSIKYQERAIKEYESAATWYLEHSKAAAINFEIAIQEKIDLLRLAPGSYKKTYKHFHEVSLKKYPFSIVYFIDEPKHLVIISSVFHHKRNPRLKFRK